MPSMDDSMHNITIERMFMDAMKTKKKDAVCAYWWVKDEEDG